MVGLPALETPGYYQRSLRDLPCRTQAITPKVTSCQAEKLAPGIKLPACISVNVHAGIWHLSLNRGWARVTIGRTPSFLASQIRN
jgi:hypothetical protein